MPTSGEGDFTVEALHSTRPLSAPALLEAPSTNVRRRPKRHIRFQPLSVELNSCNGSAYSHFVEDSWRGEILDGFLFLGDRVTASDSDRLRALGITCEAQHRRGVQRASARRVEARGEQHLTERDATGKSGGVRGSLGPT
jgi:hypothetical protein